MALPPNPSETAITLYSPIPLAFGNHRHQHRPWLQQGHRPRHYCPTWQASHSFQPAPHHRHLFRSAFLHRTSPCLSLPYSTVYMSTVIVPDYHKVSMVSPQHQGKPSWAGLRVSFSQSVIILQPFKNVVNKTRKWNYFPSWDNLMQSMLASQLTMWQRLTSTFSFLWH